MSDDKIILSQSLMKALNKGQELNELGARDNPRCPAKAKAIYIDGMESKPTQAMIKGNYFETLVYGGVEDGSAPRMKLKENGGKTTEQIRVEAQAAKFKGRIRIDKRMDFKKPRVHITVPISKHLPLYFRARIDMVTSFLDENGEFFDEVIMDTKITDNVLSTFPAEFGWGNPFGMDHTQAISYSWAYEKQFGKRVPFWYCVMDVSTQEQYRFIGGMISDTQITEFKNDLTRTVELLMKYFKDDNWPLVPSSDNCRNCPIKATCPAYSMGSDIIRIW